MKSLGFCAAVLLTSAVISTAHHNDPLSPVIRLLKEIRKARKHGGGFGREGEDRVGEDGLVSASNSQPSFSSQNQGDQRITIQIPNYPITPRPPSSPEDIRRINDGVSTILGGVGSLNLEQILRGSFMFTRNNNVRSVANNVISSIFGPPPSGGGGGGGGDGGERGGPGRN